MLFLFYELRRSAGKAVGVVWELYEDFCLSENRPIPDKFPLISTKYRILTDMLFWFYELGRSARRVVVTLGDALRSFVLAH